MAEQPRKIKKYRKPLNLNIGMLIFGAIFIYVIICVILYFQTDHIVRYEVTEGSLATNNIYRGVSIRTEEVVSTDLFRSVSGTDLALSCFCFCIMTFLAFQII